MHPDWYLNKRQAVEAVFARREETPYTPLPAYELLCSPSGRFRLALTHFKDKDDGTWAYSRGRVFKGDGVIADVKRNYITFPFAWVDPHPVNHQTYLICGEDYQGQTVINCDTGERWDHIHPSAAGGGGFCWAALHPQPRDPSLLAVEGCVWAGQYEVLFARLHVDGRLEELGRVGEGNTDFLGWLDDGQRMRLRWEITVVKSTGKPLTELSDAEEAEHEARYRDFAALPEARRLEIARDQELYSDIVDETDKSVEVVWDVDQFLSGKLPGPARGS